jgi:hypothetical protein
MAFVREENQDVDIRHELTIQVKIEDKFPGLGFKIQGDREYFPRLFRMRDAEGGQTSGD